MVNAGYVLPRERKRRNGMVAECSGFQARSKLCRVYYDEEKERIKNEIYG